MIGGTVSAAVRGRSIELATWLGLALLLAVAALALEPAVTGDGACYLSMLTGLAEHGSPEVTEAIGHSVQDRIGVRCDGLTERAASGRVYALHFFAYPLLCVPAYALLQLAGADTLRAFQLTNAVLLAAALLYVLLLSAQSRVVRMSCAGLVVLSSGSFYFQWTDPGLFSTALMLVSALALVDRRYTLAAWAAGLSSLQNPPTALFLLPALIAQALELRGRPRRETISGLLASAAAAGLALVPFAWNLTQFGRLLSIESVGFIRYLDPTLIGVRRLLLFVFDLNEGLIVGLPALLWLVPAALLCRTLEARRDRRCLLRHEDLVLVGFVLIAVPTLAQANWSAGQSVFNRYAAWAGMAPLVWAASALAGRRAAGLASVAAPALLLQLGTWLYMGGMALALHPSSLALKPWVVPLWRALPHVYDPLPDVFAERLSGREVWAIEAPVVLRDADGVILRVLGRGTRRREIGPEVCGEGGALVPADARRSSAAKTRSTELGYTYLTGRLRCAAPAE